MPVPLLASVSMGLLILVYIGLESRTLGKSWQAFKTNMLAEKDPYDEKRQAKKRDALHIIHHTLPSVILPLFLALMATLVYWPNIIFIIAVFFLYGLYNPQRWAVFISSKLNKQTNPHVR